jgi:hypothetical protein
MCTYTYVHIPRQMYNSYYTRVWMKRVKITLKCTMAPAAADVFCCCLCCHRRSMASRNMCAAVRFPRRVCPRETYLLISRTGTERGRRFEIPETVRKRHIVYCFFFFVFFFIYLFIYLLRHLCFSQATDRPTAQYLPSLVSLDPSPSPSPPPSASLPTVFRS